MLNGFLVNASSRDLAQIEQRLELQVEADVCFAVLVWNAQLNFAACEPTETTLVRALGRVLNERRAGSVPHQVQLF